MAPERSAFQPREQSLGISTIDRFQIIGERARIAGTETFNIFNKLNFRFGNNAGGSELLVDTGSAEAV